MATTSKKPEPTCETCAFSREAETSYQEVAAECRRLPPQQGGTQARPEPYPFPIVPLTAWCGEHQPKPKEKDADNGKETE